MSRIQFSKKIRASVIAIIVMLIWAFPVYWLINTALTPQGELFTPTPHFFPARPSFEHFKTALFSANFSTYLTNSIIVTLLAVLIAIAIAFMACTALTMYRFKSQRKYMFALMAMQMIPGTAMLIPQFIVFNRFGLLDTYSGVILAYVASILPVSIWNMRSFFLSMPKTLFESARVEGASEWQILTRITFPLAAPGIISTSVFAFIHSWNDYVIAYTFMKTQSHYTLPVWLATFSTPSGIDIGAQMAASLLFSLPVVIFFMIVQHGLIQGSTQGAVK
ncbi:MAG: carbohydrate ABC transporter permease [Bifidobacteriaceae bacterium]|nr:carbohydrate ABC transporter permease [Bifidobacteriaceae bacterium]